MMFLVAGSAYYSAIRRAIAAFAGFVADVVPFTTPPHITYRALRIDFLKNLCATLPAFTESAILLSIAPEYLRSHWALIFTIQNEMRLGLGAFPLNDLRLGNETPLIVEHSDTLPRKPRRAQEGGTVIDFEASGHLYFMNNRTGTT